VCAPVHIALSPQGDELSPRGSWGICVLALPEGLTSSADKLQEWLVPPDSMVGFISKTILYYCNTYWYGICRQEQAALLRPPFLPAIVRLSSMLLVRCAISMVLYHDKRVGFKTQERNVWCGISILHAMPCHQTSQVHTISIPSRQDSNA
jgi:hypothetical protein